MKKDPQQRDRREKKSPAKPQLQAQAQSSQPAKLEEGFQRFEAAPPQLRLVKPEPAQEPVSADGAPTSVAHSFIQMLNRFQEQRHALLKWIGARTYDRALKDQNPAGRFRKGSMLDGKVE
ncbi:MAG: hypothetical protein ACXVBW_00715 [Bdellovibrionota bacterium]